MSFDEDELRRRLEAVAAQVSAPRFAVEGLARRVRRRRAGIIGAVSGSFLAVAALAVAVPVGLSGPGQPAPHGPGPASSLPPGRPPSPVFTPANPPPAPTAVRGTLLLTCNSANWGQLPSNWRAGSLKAGALWFVSGRQLGYVHDSGSSVGRTGHGHNGVLGNVMIVEVTAGSRVVVRVAPQARSYFRFLAGFGSGTAYHLPAGDNGYTFAACPRGGIGPNGEVTDFYLGFSIKAGRQAPVDVWTSPSPRPVRVIFTAPR